MTPAEDARVLRAVEAERACTVRWFRKLAHKELDIVRISGCPEARRRADQWFKIADIFKAGEHRE